MNIVGEKCVPFSAAQPLPGQVTLSIEGVVWQELGHEAERQGVEVDELVRHALLYYLADVDSGRTARMVPRLDQAAPGGLI